MVDAGSLRLCLEGFEVAVTQGLDDTERFAFGRNWLDFADAIEPRQVAEAGLSLTERLGADLTGKTFVDVGCGSGIFSVAARELGARVTSFDVDADSVACTQAMKRRFRPDDPDWVIVQGSVLDPAFVGSLGTYDVVYSWGVLHHTGDMWAAIDAATGLANPSAQLFISIYNDQGDASRRWWRIKRRYNRGGRWNRGSAVALGVGYRYLPAIPRVVGRALHRQSPFASTPEGRARGMDRKHDLIDWIGGYPFEVATPESIFTVLRDSGWVLDYLGTVGGGHGCNEFVFSR